MCPSSTPVFNFPNLKGIPIKRSRKTIILVLTLGVWSSLPPSLCLSRCVSLSPILPTHPVFCLLSVLPSSLTFTPCVSCCCGELGNNPSVFPLYVAACRTPCLSLFDILDISLLCAFSSLRNSLLVKAPGALVRRPLPRCIAVYRKQNTQG